MNGDGCWVECPPERLGTFLLSEFPHTLYLPETFTPGYAYPLVCYLHDDGRSEADLWRWFPGISDQNFIGLGIRAPFPVADGTPGAYRWAAHRPDAAVATLCEAATQTERDWNVHPRRVFLLGDGTGAVAALQLLMLQQTQYFYGELRVAGVVCHGLPEDWPHRLPAVNEELRGRLLLMDKLRTASEFAAVDALAEAGMEISFAGQFPHPAAEAVNHWLMSSVSTAVF